MNTNLYVIRPIRWSALILMLTLVATNVFAAADEFTERFDFAPGQTLKLDLSSGGSVTIEGWDQPGIEVTYGDEHNSLDQYSIDFEPSTTGLSVNASQSKHADSSNGRLRRSTASMSWSSESNSGSHSGFTAAPSMDP